MRSRRETNDESGKKAGFANIVLIEDNPADASLVRKVLEEHGVEGRLTVISDGEMALRLVCGQDTESIACPDLVILDLNLPRRPGRDVLQAIRASERCAHIPIFVLSSSDAEQDKADARRLGATLYIRKPSTLDEFLGLGSIFKDVLSFQR